MLLITMGLLTGASFLSLASIKGASSFITAGADRQTRAAGQLLTIVSTQTNTTGSYIWLYNYGWEDANLNSVLVNGASVQQTSCSRLRQESICVVVLPARTSGLVTLVIGDRSVELNL